MRNPQSATPTFTKDTAKKNKMQELRLDNFANKTADCRFDQVAACLCVMPKSVYVACLDICSLEERISEGLPLPFGASTTARPSSG